MRRVVVALVALGISLGLSGQAVAQLDGSAGYSKWFIVPENSALPLVQEDALSASISWRVEHLWLAWSWDEDAVGYAVAGYGDKCAGIDWSLGPGFVALNHLGDDGTFGLGAFVRLGFDVPAGGSDTIPAEFIAGWARTIRDAKISGADEPYHAVTLQLRTTFRLRK